MKKVDTYKLIFGESSSMAESHVMSSSLDINTLANECIVSYAGSVRCGVLSQATAT